MIHSLEDLVLVLCSYGKKKLSFYIMLIIISLVSPSVLSHPYGVGVLGKDGKVEPECVFFSVQPPQNIKVIPAAQLKQADPSRTCTVLYV